MTLHIKGSDGQVGSTMATVKLDMRDPVTKEVVSSWADNTEYTIRTGVGPNRAIAEVVEAPEEPEGEEMEGEETETESEMPTPGPASSPGATVMKKAMGMSQ